MEASLLPHNFSKKENGGPVPLLQLIGLKILHKTNLNINGITKHQIERMEEEILQ